MSYEITEVRKFCVFIKGSFQVLIDSCSIMSFQMLLFAMEKITKMPTVSILLQNGNVSCSQKLDGQNSNISTFKIRVYLYKRKEIERDRGEKGWVKWWWINICNRDASSLLYLLSYVDMVRCPVYWQHLM